MKSEYAATGHAQAAAAGQRAASENLLAALYPELREIARKQFRRVRPGQIGYTLQPTALVHDAYLRLFKSGCALPTLRDREHFLNLFACCMRRVFLDYVKERKAKRRGGGAVHALLDGEFLDHREPAPHDYADRRISLESLLAALERLATRYPDDAGGSRQPSTCETESPPPCRKRDIATLHLVAGWSLKTIAEETGLALKDVKREWAFAKAWLYKELERNLP